MTPHDHDREKCRETFAKLSEYIDGELDPELCEAIDGHMDLCAPCQAFVESLRRTVDLTNNLPQRELPEDLARELADAYQKAVEARRGRDSGKT